MFLKARKKKPVELNRQLGSRFTHLSCVFGCLDARELKSQIMIFYVLKLQFYDFVKLKM